MFLIIYFLAEFVEDAHFGGGMLKKSSSEGYNSRKDMIEQLIAESKKRKAEKQQAREQTIELTEKLDSEWKDLLPIVSASKISSSNVVDDNDKPDSYDTVMRQLKFEARGKVCYCTS
jgi:nucleolar protein 14